MINIAHNSFRSKKFSATVFLISVFYLVISVYLINFDFVKTTLIGSFDLLYKIKILFLLLGSLFTSITPFEISILILLAVLTGFNLSFLYYFSIKNNKHFLNLSGSSLGILAGGCASCGLPLLGALGLGAGVSILPLAGQEFSIIALIILFFSTYYLLKSHENLKCEVHSKTLDKISNPLYPRE